MPTKPLLNNPPKLPRIIGKIIFFCFLATHVNKSAAEVSPSLPVVVAPQRLASPDAASYVGAKKCSTCHLKQYQKWQSSRHAQALVTLKGSRETSPGCLRCHTTGYGAQDGFSNPEQMPQLAGVQCEACHGRGSRHLEDVNQPGWEAITDCVDCQIRRVCMVCHTPKHSPNFDFEGYLDKVSCGAE